MGKANSHTPVVVGRRWQEVRQANRLKRFGLSLHEHKTRLIRFGRLAKSDLQKAGGGKPDTVEFLGFTHFCSVTRSSGRFTVIRETSKKRMRMSLQGIKTCLLKHRHDAVPEQLKWLKRVVQGHMNYFAVPGNSCRINSFRTEVQKIWYTALKRRSQRSRLNWKKFGAFINTVLPKVRVLHPWPEQRFGVKYSGQEPYAPAVHVWLWCATRAESVCS